MMAKEGDVRKKAKAPERPALPEKKGKAEKVDWRKMLLESKGEERLEAIELAERMAEKVDWREMLLESEGEDRLKAIELARESRDPEAVPVLLKLLWGYSYILPYFSEEAAHAIMAIGINEEQHEELLNMLCQCVFETVKGATIALSIHASETGDLTSLPDIAFRIEKSISRGEISLDRQRPVLEALLLFGEPGVERLKSIARKGDPAVKELIVSFFEDPSEDCISRLIGMLEDEDPRLAMEAGKALNRMAGMLSDEHIEAIHRILEGMDFEGNGGPAAFIALSGVDPDRLHAIINEDNGQASAAPEGSGSLQEDRVVELMPDWERRLSPSESYSTGLLMEAVRSAGEMKDPDALPFLLKLFEHGCPPGPVAKAIVDIGIDEELYSDLVGMLSSDSWGAQAGAAMTLDLHGDERSFQHILDSLQRGPEPGIMRDPSFFAALLSLGGDEGLRHVLGFARDGNLDAKELAVSIIQDHDDGAPRLIQMLGDEDPELAMAAGRALGSMGGTLSDGHIEAIEVSFHDWNESEKRAAAEALLGLDPGKARTYLMKMLYEGNDDTQRETLRCILRSYENEQNPGGYVETLKGLAEHVGSDPEYAAIAVQGIKNWVLAAGPQEAERKPIIDNFIDLVDAFLADIQGNSSFEGRLVSSEAFLARVSIRQAKLSE